MFTVCLNTDPYTYLGTRGLSLVPEATLDTPLAIVTFRSLSLGRLLPVFAGALGIGRVTAVSSSSIDVRTDVVEAAISASRPVPWQVDGDHLGEATTLTVRHEPDALDLVVPLASAAFG